MKPDERRKISEFVAQRAEAIAHLADFLEKEFAKSPEGLEAIYLKGVLDHYLNNMENFLVHFVSGVPGQRGVDIMINGLEHPQSMVKPDSSLIKELKRIRDEMKKENIPDMAEWKHYTALLEEVGNLQAKQDIHLFRDELNSLLVKAAHYPETRVGRILKEYSSKDIPRIIELEDFEVAVLLWKLILSRLCLPGTDQQAIFSRAAGAVNTAGIIEELASKLEILSKRSKDLADLAPGLQQGIAATFRSTTETNNWDNLKGLAASASAGGKSYIIRLLNAMGQDKYASHLVALFGEKGGQLDQPKTVKTIAGIILRLEKEKISIEVAARDELHSMLDSMMKEMRKNLAKERDEYSKVISKRVNELEHRHAKNLAKVQEMENELKGMIEKVAVGYIAANEINEKAAKLENARREFNIRSADILVLMRARIASRRFMINAPNYRQNDFTAEIDQILKMGPSGFAARMITNIRQLVENRYNNRMTAEQYDEAMKKVDAFIDQLGRQIPAITSRQKDVSRKLMELGREAEDTMKWIDFRLKQADQAAIIDLKQVRHMGITEDRIRTEGKESITQEDLAALKLRKAA